MDREVNSGFFYKSSEERVKMVAAERVFTNDKVQKVIDLKRQVTVVSLIIYLGFPRAICPS